LTQGEQGYEAHALRLLAEIERSESGYRAALARAEAVGMRPLIDRCALGLRALRDGTPAPTPSS
jgi:hypothetical protein